jgi:hypothetical protein
MNYAASSWWLCRNTVGCTIRLPTAVYTADDASNWTPNVWEEVAYAGVAVGTCRTPPCPGSNITIDGNGSTINMTHSIAAGPEAMMFFCNGNPDLGGDSGAALTIMNLTVQWTEEDFDSETQTEWNSVVVGEECTVNLRNVTFLGNPHQFVYAADAAGGEIADHPSSETSSRIIIDDNILDDTVANVPAIYVWNSGMGQQSDIEITRNRVRDPADVCIQAAGATHFDDNYCLNPGAGRSDDDVIVGGCFVLYPPNTGSAVTTKVRTVNGNKCINSASFFTSTACSVAALYDTTCVQLPAHLSNYVYVTDAMCRPPTPDPLNGVGAWTDRYFFAGSGDAKQLIPIRAITCPSWIETEYPVYVPQGSAFELSAGESLQWAWIINVSVGSFMDNYTEVGYYPPTSGTAIADYTGNTVNHLAGNYFYWCQTSVPSPLAAPTCAFTFGSSNNITGPGNYDYRATTMRTPDSSQCANVSLAVGSTAPVLNLVQNCP